jgi:hypothetical protein
VKKLLDLKQWLTIADAARYLSILFGEGVSEADVLRLGLDGHLKLSVNFVNGARGRCGPAVRSFFADSLHDRALLGARVLEYAAEAVRRGGTHLTSEGEREPISYSLKGLNLGDGRVLEYGQKATWIDGVWDLTMLGHERLEIEQRYWLLTEGPDVDMPFQDGALDHPIVSREDGIYCQLHEPRDDERNRYHPAYELPADSVLVVRTSALHDLEARISPPDQRTEKPIERRERATLLVMIAALAQLAKIDVSRPSSAAAAIESQANLMGVRAAARTIENHLRAIPEALERRSS